MAKVILCKCGCGYTVGKPPAVADGQRAVKTIKAEIRALERELADLRAERASGFECLQCGGEVECAALVREWREEQRAKAAAEAEAADKEAGDA